MNQKTLANPCTSSLSDIETYLDLVRQKQDAMVLGQLGNESVGNKNLMRKKQDTGEEKEEICQSLISPSDIS